MAVGDILFAGLMAYQCNATHRQTHRALAERCL